ncbi:DUF6686 family protein [Tunicatimonas pelagia]|uniref:DUF6686 family protein n=1 Tax=Tunicatimonas pelagia TaxID=931531 RepID=UPI0026668050|nr:DUF6686 family protein [Tunicatimonas pelagia]WKN43011.1 hypothetical protein P0M28_28640 [Tunicatimonas pelagia]
MNKSPFELLEENEFAYVAYRVSDHRASSYRKQAEILQLSFGNVSLQLNPTEFARLQKQVAETLEQIQIVRDPYYREFIISTSVRNMVFTFSYCELCQINQVMVNTQTMLEVGQIINLPNSSTN